MKLFLAGDIGGTKTRLSLSEVNGEKVVTRRETSYASQDHSSFNVLLKDFLSLGEKVADAAFGIAGPVLGEVAQATNLPWQIDAAALRQEFGFMRCYLLNDLEATAYGLPALGEAGLWTLQPGSSTQGNSAIIAAGTGLGEAGLYWDGSSHHPFATEGGHATFSPRNPLECALLDYLRLRHSSIHISWERVVSGMGLLDLYGFLIDHRKASTPPWLKDDMQATDKAAAISAAALSSRDDICVETLQWFVSLYGAEAGNLALKTMSRGGLYIGGGIAPKILPLLKSGEFLASFLDKGRMRPLLEAMPIHIILNDRAALYGPALYAAQHAKTPSGSV
ncbi:MAG: glucokinase [Ferrovum sp.]|nr:glucokinase [Ferrovum sp.]NDU86641.1 glucokinase [Ferrovum sp.]